MKKYDEEFKQQAVKKILGGQSVASVSRELGVSEGVLHKWKQKVVVSHSEVEKAVIDLEKRLRTVEMENEILKKAKLFFGREVSQIPVHPQGKHQLSGQSNLSGDAGYALRLLCLSEAESLRATVLPGQLKPKLEVSLKIKLAPRFN